MEHNDLLMWSMYQEKSGSTLLKLRFAERNDGGHSSGEGTQNSNMHFRRKSQKQANRDMSRAHDHNVGGIGMRTRSKIDSVSCEKPRTENSLFASSPPFRFSEVASPEPCGMSPAACNVLNTPVLEIDTEQSPEPSIRAKTTYDSHVSCHRDDSSPAMVESPAEHDVTLPNVNESSVAATDENICNDDVVHESSSSPRNRPRRQFGVEDFDWSSFGKRLDDCLSRSLSRSIVLEPNSATSNAQDPKDDT